MPQNEWVVVDHNKNRAIYAGSYDDCVKWATARWPLARHKRVMDDIYRVSDMIAIWLKDRFEGKKL